MPLIFVWLTMVMLTLPWPGEGQQEVQSLTTYWIDERTATTFINDDGTVEATWLFGGEGDKAYWGVITLKPGARVAPHTHESDEYLYILSGRAKFMAGDQTTTVKPGLALHIPAGTLHSSEVVGSHALKAVQAYVPPGPNERFTKWRKKG